MYEGLTEEDLEIGNASVQLFVAFYTGLPYAYEGEDIYLPVRAARILQNQRDLTEDQAAYLENHTIFLDHAPSTDLADGEVSEDHTPQAPGQGQGGQSSSTTHDEGAAIVSGKTTFYELLDWGVTEEQIETVIGAEMPGTALLVRDYCTQNGLQFGQIKGELQVFVDAAQAEQP